MGGTSSKDAIENLQGLCRECHIHFGDKKQYLDYLKETHKSFIDNYAKKY
jgi:5-methylcytosine-specific restriction endonuclease McrA